jgi:hypothetical protein
MAFLLEQRIDQLPGTPYPMVMHEQRTEEKEDQEEHDQEMGPAHAEHTFLMLLVLWGDFQLFPEPLDVGLLILDRGPRGLIGSVGGERVRHSEEEQENDENKFDFNPHARLLEHMSLLNSLPRTRDRQGMCK